eukprot:m.301316 g.301316  ORF g.301316 m.301316 type:complete len:127 (+) comp14714_c0_seq1:132-512(+)
MDLDKRLAMTTLTPPTPNENIAASDQATWVQVEVCDSDTDNFGSDSASWGSAVSQHWQSTIGPLEWFLCVTLHRQSTRRNSWRGQCGSLTLSALMASQCLSCWKIRAPLILWSLDHLYAIKHRLSS